MRKQQTMLKHPAFVGCALMVFGMFFFGITNAAAKSMANDLPLAEMIFFRSLLSSVAMLIYAKVTKTPFLTTSHKNLQVFRGILGFWQLFFLYWSTGALLLGDATAISFSTTLFVTALSVALLKEAVGLNRWYAVIVGFIGVLIIAQPSGDMNYTGASVATISAFLEALVMIYARKLGRTDSAFTTVFYYTVITCILGGIISIFIWKTPTLDQFGMLTLLGAAGTLGHICIAAAYRRANAATVATMFYTQIIWGVAFGYIFWQEIPSGAFFIGTPLVIISGLYIVFRETRRKVDHIPEVET